MEDFILIIAGSRDFTNKRLLYQKCDRVLSKITKNIVIRSGMANGADKLGVMYARDRGYDLEKFPANWYPNGVYSRSAGHKRNREMANGDNRYPAKANALIAFWDEKSKGTKGMIEYAEKRGLQVRVVNYTDYE